MKEKAYAYLVRETNGEKELLVFTQEGHQEAGVQVPGGTVDPGETTQEALLREVWEESGIEGLETVAEVGQAEYFHPLKKEDHHRHFFTVKTTQPLPEEWFHTVSAGINDNGLVFRYFWMPLHKAEQGLAGEQGKFIGKI